MNAIHQRLDKLNVLYTSPEKWHEVIMNVIDYWVTNAKREPASIGDGELFIISEFTWDLSHVKLGYTVSVYNKHKWTDVDEPHYTRIHEAMQSLIDDMYSRLYPVAIKYVHEYCSDKFDTVINDVDFSVSCDPSDALCNSLQRRYKFT